MNKTLKRFATIAVIEGWSYIVLLFVAMPLKYWLNLPEAVKIVGSLHGFLFVAFCLLLVQVWQNEQWSFGKVVLAFILSLIPFGTFYLDKKIKAGTY
jgi:integral membrane protein